MSTLLERLNASRRFARSVYAPHKLALRQSVPSALRAVGVTAPAQQVLRAPRSVTPVTPRAVSVAPAPVVTRAAVPSSAVWRPKTAVENTGAVNSAPLEPQGSVNLESQGSVNLESQGSVNLESQGSVNLEPQDLADLAPQDSVNSELLFPAAAFPEESPLLESMQGLSLELAAPVEIAPSDRPPMLELGGGVTAESLAPQTPLEQPVARAAPARADSSQADPGQAQSSRAPEPSIQPVAPAMPPTESRMLATNATQTPEPPANSFARAFTLSPEPVGERREDAPTPEPRSALERIENALPVSETLALSPAQPLESPPVVLVEPARLEPRLDLEAAGAALTGQGAVMLEAAMLETSPASTTASSFESAPEVIASGVATAAKLEVVAPPTADLIAAQPVLESDPIQTPARGRVIEEFQARPPRNMPLRNMPLKAAEPEPTIEAAVGETPRRSPEEWARLLRQRFAQPGDEAFDDSVTPVTPAALHAGPSNSSVPAASPESRTDSVIPPLEGQAADGSPPAVGNNDSGVAVSASDIRERSQAALQAIPEDMTKRSPRDWGLALIRRYTSADEAAAIGIEAYRDPNDAVPLQTLPLQTQPSQPLPSVTPRATVTSAASSSSAQAVPIGLEAAARPARRFVAARNSPAPGLGTVAPSPVASVQAGSPRAQPVQPAAQQRSSSSVGLREQSSDLLNAAPQIPASLAPSRSAIASSPALDAPLETATLAAPQTESAPDPAAFSAAQNAPAAITERPASDASLSADSSPSITLKETALPDAPPLEPVRLSGATRRFLEPLVGFDPNEVSVYTGERASRLTRDLRADAAAQHGAVLLPDASNLETPAQLGLLAHELIHAAQQQQSDAGLEPTLESPFQAPPLESSRPFESASRRFVPAIGSSDTRSSAQISAQPNVLGQFSNPAQFSNAVRQSSAPINQGISTFASEEQRARTAEARVTQIARSGQLSSMPANADPTSADPNSWNGLPAPWESLPSFEASSSDDGVVSLIGAGLSLQSWGASATTNPSGYGGSVSSSNTGASGSAAGSDSSASSAAQAAESGRELPNDGGGAAAAGTDAAPDVEQLAKQVYDVLKRRLQSDRRRGGL